MTATVFCWPIGPVLSEWNADEKSPSISLWSFAVILPPVRTGSASILLRFPTRPQSSAGADVRDRLSAFQAGFARIGSASSQSASRIPKLRGARVAGAALAEVKLNVVKISAVTLRASVGAEQKAPRGKGGLLPSCRNQEVRGNAGPSCYLSVY